MVESALYPRYARPRLEEALTDTPVVLLHGPRQCGKTTLARQVADRADYQYITFDDGVVLAAAQADPDAETLAKSSAPPPSSNALLTGRLEPRKFAVLHR